MSTSLASEWLEIFVLLQKREFVCLVEGGLRTGVDLIPPGRWICINSMSWTFCFEVFELQAIAAKQVLDKTRNVIV